MEVKINNYNLLNNYKYKQPIFKQTLNSYNNLVLRTFKPLPEHGKLSELAKRLGVIAAPVIYSLLGLCLLMSNCYYTLTGWYVGKILEDATYNLKPVLTEQGHGHGPYELVVLLSVRSQGVTLYSDLTILESDHYENGYLPFFLEKIEDRTQVIKENLKKFYFNIGQNIEVEWKGFLKNGVDGYGAFSNIISRSDRNRILISPYGGSGSGGGIYNDLENTKLNFEKYLNTLNVTQPDEIHHFTR